MSTAHQHHFCALAATSLTRLCHVRNLGFSQDQTYLAQSAGLFLDKQPQHLCPQEWQMLHLLCTATFLLRGCSEVLPFQSCHHGGGCFGLAFGPAIIFHANFKPQRCHSRMPANCWCGRVDQVCTEIKTEMRWDGQAGPSLQRIPTNASKWTPVKALHVNWYRAQFRLLKLFECLQKY